MGARTSLHRIHGVDPAVMVAIPKEAECDLMPDRAWQSAAAIGQYGPDPAEGSSCPEPQAPAPRQ